MIGDGDCVNGGGDEVGVGLFNGEILAAMGGFNCVGEQLTNEGVSSLISISISI
jgi:hypothetical protein